MTKVGFVRISLVAAVAAGVAGAVIGSRAQTTPRMAFIGARIIDGSGRPPIDNGVLVINNGMVESVGASSSVRVPADATRVDVAGKTIMPGLINAHGHLSDGDEKQSLHDQIVSQLRLYADYGVTTLHSLGDDGFESVKVRDAQGKVLDESRLFVSGQSLSSLLRDKTVADARALVDKYAAMKVNIIKFHVEGVPGDPNKLKPEMYRAIIDQAHKDGLRAAAHLYYLEDAKGLLDAGVNVMAHSVRDQEVDAPFVAELKRRDVAYIPTLTRDLSMFVYESTPEFFKDPFFLRHVNEYRKQIDQLLDPSQQAKTRASDETQRSKKALSIAERNLKRIADGGVTIALGTDTGIQLGRWQGYFEHTELQMMVESGLTPAQVIVAATSGAAKAMKLSRIGALAPGNFADFLVLGGNPLDDIRNTRKLESVWIGGHRQGGRR